MTEELGKISKPEAEGFRAGRKLYFIPLLFTAREVPPDFQELVDKYWKEVDIQVSNLETKLGLINRIYHELVPGGGPEAVKALEELNARSYVIARSRLDSGATLESVEEADLLTEFMDWGKCLSTGLQNQKVFDQIYTAYNEARKKRNQHMAKQIDDTLKAGEAGVLLMREGHQVQFPADIQVFYISPPSLDEIKRWFRDREDNNK